MTIFSALLPDADALSNRFMGAHPNDWSGLAAYMTEQYRQARKLCLSVEEALRKSTEARLRSIERAASHIGADPGLSTAEPQEVTE